MKLTKIPKKTKQFIRINLEIIFGVRLNYEEIRKENICFVRDRVIFNEAIVAKEYDLIYESVKDHDKAKYLTLAKLIKGDL